MSDISLTASMRSNLLSLQNTQSLMDMTQERLSTGKKVNSAIDNPSSYYTAQSLTNRASDLEGLLDSMGQGIQTIQAANEGIEAITSFVQQAKAVANTARDTAVKTELTAEFEISAAAIEVADVKIEVGGKTYTLKTQIGASSKENAVATALGNAEDAESNRLSSVLKITGTDGSGSLKFEAADGVTLDKTSISITGLSKDIKGTINPNDRDSSIAQFNEILNQIDQIASDSSYKGVNLLKKDDLKVVFNEDRSSYLDVEGKDATTAGLKLSAVTDWSTSDAVDASISQVEAAINTLRDMASEFGNNYSIVQTRQDFTENLINVLEEGADNLTLADMNEESANMLALQTRQQLAINSLSLASQAAQSVLSLF